MFHLCGINLWLCRKEIMITSSKIQSLVFIWLVQRYQYYYISMYAGVVVTGDYFSESKPIDLTMVLWKWIILAVVLASIISWHAQLFDEISIIVLAQTSSGCSWCSLSTKKGENHKDVGSAIPSGDVSSAPVILSSIVILLTTGVAMVIGRRMNWIW